MQGKSFVSKLSSLLLALVMIFSVTAGVSTVSAAAKTKKSKAKVSKVVVTNTNKKVLYVAKGKKVAVKTDVKVKPNKKANKKVTYKVTSKKVATVTAKGIVKGKKVGSTKLTVASKLDSKKKTTVTVKVTNPVKKVSLNTYLATVTVGDKVKLKASVTPKKKTCNVVNWKTSNASVATVNNGVVTTKKAGTVKVTAVAADGSDKKATCTITVQSKTDLNSVSIINPKNKTYSSVLSVNLSNAQALSKDNFTVKTKSYQNGTYRKTLKVESISTKDNKSYVIYLKDDMWAGNYYSVTASGIRGVNTKETFFRIAGKSYTEQFAAEVGDKFNYDEYDEEGWSIDFYNMMGCYTVSVESGSLPAGLKLDDEKQGYIVGEAKALANNQKVVFAATDELGNVSKTTVNFVIGDDNHVYAQNITRGVNDNDYVYANRYDEFYIRAVGGSGDYKIELLDAYDGKFELESSYGRTACIDTNSEKLTAGTYNVRVKFTDRNNSNLWAIGTLTIVVKPTFAVTSEILNSPNTDIYYREIYSGEGYWGYSNEKGTALMYIPAGTYNVYAEDAFGERVILNNSVTVSKAETFTYAKPSLYKVSGKIIGSASGFSVRLINSKNESTDNYRSSYDYDDDYTYEFYNVPSGTYTLEVYSYNRWQDESTKVYTTTVTVGNQNVTVGDIRVNNTIGAPSTIASITGPNTVPLTATNGISYIKFTPSKSGYYVIYSNNDYDYDTYGYFYESDGYQITSNDDGGSGNNFRMVVSVEAGETYYIGAKDYDDNSGRAMSVVVEETDYETYDNYINDYED